MFGQNQNKNLATELKANDPLDNFINESTKIIIDQFSPDAYCSIVSAIKTKLKDRLNYLVEQNQFEVKVSTEHIAKVESQIQEFKDILFNLDDK